MTQNKDQADVCNTHRFSIDSKYQKEFLGGYTAHMYNEHYAKSPEEQARALEEERRRYWLPKEEEEDVSSN